MPDISHLLSLASGLEPLHGHPSLPVTYVLGADVFTWLGRLPVVVVLALLVRAALRRGWPLRSTLLTTAVLAAGFALGARVLPSIVGALAGGLAAWLAAQRFLGLRRPPLATFALGVAATLAIGRLGCLLAGCCFGVPTELPWAVHYGAGSPAYQLHHALGWLTPAATTSLGVHPTPLYESLGLVAWLALARPLRRRLRSEGALLLFTAGFDLGLRALVDGARAMINVWWALLGDALGLDYFRLALLAGGLACVAVGLGLERSARRTAVEAEATVVAVGAWRPWLVFATLVAAVLVGGVAQRPFLSVVVLLLAASAMTLELPLLPVLDRPAPAWSGPALALALLLPLAAGTSGALLSLPGGDVAGPATATGPRRPIRLYEVDPERKLLVRVGTDEDPPGDVAEVRTDLDLPQGEPLPPPPPPMDPATHLWLSAGGLGGDASEYDVDCDGNRTRRISARGAVGGSLGAEVELPSEDDAVFLVGGRAGFVRENVTAYHLDTTTGTGTYVGHDESVRAAFGHVWVERESPYFTFGVGALAARLMPHSSYATGVEDGWVLAPGFHLRLGARAIGGDVGFADRDLAELPRGHLGVSGRLGVGPGGDRRDGLVGYRLGILLLPSPYGFSSLGKDVGASHYEPSFGGSLELRASPWVSVGFEFSAYDSSQYTNAFGALWVRLRPF